MALECAAIAPRTSPQAKLSLLIRPVTFTLILPVTRTYVADLLELHHTYRLGRNITF